MREIPTAALTQHGVFTSVQAFASGWTPAGLKHALRCCELERVGPGLFARVTAPHSATATARARVEAAASALSHRGAVVSHRSAALLMGLSVLTVPNRPCLTTRPGTCGSWPSGSSHIHRGRLGNVDAFGDEGIRRTSLARTVIDVAREAGVEQAVVIADAAFERGLLNPAALLPALSRLPGGPGLPAAARAVALARYGAQSPLESVSRLRLERAGLPEATRQETLLRVDGRFLGRVDFYWDDVGVVGEADGMGKYVSLEVVRAEKLRQERLEQAGLVVVRWGWHDLDNVAALAARINTAHDRGSRRLAEDRRWRTGIELGHRQWPGRAVVEIDRPLVSGGSGRRISTTG